MRGEVQAGRRFAGKSRQVVVVRGEVQAGRCSVRKVQAGCSILLCLLSAEFWMGVVVCGEVQAGR